MGAYVSAWPLIVPHHPNVIPSGRRADSKYSHNENYAFIFGILCKWFELKVRVL